MNMCFSLRRHDIESEIQIINNLKINFKINNRNQSIPPYNKKKN